LKEARFKACFSTSDLLIEGFVDGCGVHPGVYPDPFSIYYLTSFYDKADGYLASCPLLFIFLMKKEFGVLPFYIISGKLTFYGYAKILNLLNSSWVRVCLKVCF